MSANHILSNSGSRDWLSNTALSSVSVIFVESLRAQRYSERTISIYARCLAHFAFWMETEKIQLADITQSEIQRFIKKHLPHCKCPRPSARCMTDNRAALRHLLAILPKVENEQKSKTAVFFELERFEDYLVNVCGLAPQTCLYRLKHVKAFLAYHFSNRTLDISTVKIADVDRFMEKFTSGWRPSSRKTVCTNLRSYFRYRVVKGDAIQQLLAAIPKVAQWRQSTLPKSLSESQLELFLRSFDQDDPIQLRDYAIALCLVDLGLRGQEVASLCLEHVDWRSGMLTIFHNKCKRIQQLPLPPRTGEAIVYYLRRGRPCTTNRAIFVRHAAPYDKPISVDTVRKAMTRAFARCGLDDQFCNTHVLRHTTAVRLQKAGASLKEIADVMRHQNLNTTATYARVDLEGLRVVALPWVGRSV